MVASQYDFLKVTEDVHRGAESSFYSNHGVICDAYTTPANSAVPWVSACLQLPCPAMRVPVPTTELVPICFCPSNHGCANPD